MMQHYQSGPRNPKRKRERRNSIGLLFIYFYLVITVFLFLLGLALLSSCILRKQIDVSLILKHPSFHSAAFFLSLRFLRLPFSWSSNHILSPSPPLSLSWSLLWLLSAHTNSWYLIEGKEREEKKKKRKKRRKKGRMIGKKRENGRWGKRRQEEKRRKKGREEGRNRGKKKRRKESGKEALLDLACLQLLIPDWRDWKEEERERKKGRRSFARSSLLAPASLYPLVYLIESVYWRIWEKALLLFQTAFSKKPK